MSYINEALKKAQKERDGLFDAYEGVLTTENPKRGVRSKTVLKWAIPCFIIVFLAFFLFSWLDSDNTTSMEKEDADSIVEPGLPDTVHASISFHRARLFQKEGQKEKAKKNYLETLRLNPGDVKALNNLGVIYMQEKDYPRAMTHFRKAIKTKADYVEPYYNLACLYTMQKDQEKGLSFFEKGCFFGPIRYSMGPRRSGSCDPASCPRVSGPFGCKGLVGVGHPYFRTISDGYDSILKRSY